MMTSFAGASVSTSFTVWDRERAFKRGGVFCELALERKNERQLLHRYQTLTLVS